MAVFAYFNHFFKNLKLSQVAHIKVGGWEEGWDGRGMGVGKTNLVE